MKKRKCISSGNVEQWIAEGYGQGAGKNYRPFFYVRDVPSQGRSSMVLGLKTGRIHHYLSHLEYSCHLLAEYLQPVTDIREHFALLPWKETQRTADSLGIRHPLYPGTNTPIVLTSDLVVNFGKRVFVLCVKPLSKINPQTPRAQRTLEKLLLEKTYWERRGIAWQLITDMEIPRIRVQNLAQLRVCMVATELEHLTQHMNSFLAAFDLLWNHRISLRSILNRISAKISLTQENCYCLFGRAVWLRLLDVDIDTALIHHDLPLHRVIKGN